MYVGGNTYVIDMKSFGLFYEDAVDKDDLSSLRIKELLGNPYSPRKWPLKRVCGGAFYPPKKHQNRLVLNTPSTYAATQMIHLWQIRFAGSGRVYAREVPIVGDFLVGTYRFGVIHPSSWPFLTEKNLSWTHDAIKHLLHSYQHTFQQHSQGGSTCILATIAVGTAINCFFSYPVAVSDCHVTASVSVILLLVVFAFCVSGEHNKSWSAEWIQRNFR